MHCQRIIVSTLFVFAAAVEIATGQGVIIVPEPIPHPRWPDRVTTTPLEVKYQRINAEIVEGVAVTQVQQTFVNPLRRTIEGTYVFPLPDGVAVGDFSMTADGKTLKGEVLEKDRARETYEAIVRRARDPGLLEYLGARLYQASIFPIPPGGQIDVRISYSQTLTEQGGLGVLTHPLRAQQQTSGTIREFSFSAKIRSASPISTVFCPTHACVVSRPSDKEAVIAFEQLNFQPDRDLAVYYQRSDAQFGLSLLTHRGAGERGYFLLRISPRIETRESEIQPKDIAFVIDTSGSMAGDKIAQTRKALKYCISSLRDVDRFNIYAFSTDVRPFRDALVPASADIRAAATSFAEKLEAVGGTNIHGALQAALKNDPRDETRPYLIVFMTDGQPTVDVANPDQILKNIGEANSRRVRFHVFGVGSDVNTHLLDKLAEMNRGARDYCTEREDLELKLGAFVSRLSHPVLTDITLTLKGLDATDIYPRTLPDLFRGNDLVVLGRYDADGHRTVQFDGRIRGESKSITYEGRFPAIESTNDFLPRLWANRKVAYLLDEIRLHGRNQELVDEVVRLAKRFGIVTPYTSALILEDERAIAMDGAPSPRLNVYHIARSAASPGGRTDPQPATGSAGGGLAAAGGMRQLGYGGVSGNEAVAESKDLDHAKLADAPANSSPADLLRDESGRLLLRRVGDKTFTWDGKRYVDSDWDGALETTKIESYSGAHFALLRKHPKIARYLAIFERVVVVFEGVVYEIAPAEVTR